MLISYNRPADIVWSLAGATWLSDDAGAALTNGRPAAASRISMTGSSATLRGSWGAAIVPRVVALLGLTLPVGATVALAFRRPADAGYTYAPGAPSQPVTQLADGSRCVWFALPAGLDPVIGVEFAVSGAAAGPVDIGEAWVGPTSEFCLRRTMQDSITDPTVRRRSYGSQTFASQRLPYRSIALDLVPQRDAVVGAVRAARGQVLQAERVAIVPVETDVYGTALFGTVGKFDAAAVSDARYWTATMQADEEPATPA